MMGCEPGSVRLLSGARLGIKNWKEESFKYKISVKERIDMTEYIRCMIGISLILKQE